MSDYVKLAIGDDIIIQCKAVEINKDGKWPDYHLTAADGKIIVAPKAALDRQLERMTMTPLELIGHYVKIERAPNKEDANKSWWNLSLANKGESTKAPPKRLQSPPKAEEPPAHHRESGVPSEAPRDRLEEAMNEEGLGDAFTPASLVLAERREKIESAYRWAYGTAYRAQMDVQDELMKEHSVAFNPTAESVQAGAATILIQMEKRGAI